MAASRSTVLFVHGSWHTSEHFEPVRRLFEASGFPTSCPTQPSSSGAPAEVGLDEDAACIRNELDKLIMEQGKDVIVVAHSYGGVVATQAVAEDFAKKRRAAEGQPGGVLHLVYMCAFLLPLNVSLAGQFGGTLPPFITVTEDKMCMMRDPVMRFYHDVLPNEQQNWVDRLVWCPSKGQETPITHLAYLHHPITYILCDDDQALPLGMQLGMVEGVKSNTGISIRTVHCKASHSPFLSKPEDILVIVQSLL